VGGKRTRVGAEDSRSLKRTLAALTNEELLAHLGNAWDNAAPEDLPALLEAAREILEDRGRERDLEWARVAAGTAEGLRRIQEYAKAADLLELARTTFSVHGDETRALMCDLDRAILLRDLGRRDEALSVVESAGEGWRHSGAPVEAARCDVTRANILNDLGRHEEALALYEPARQVFRRAERGCLVAACDYNTALVLKQVGRLGEALEALESARKTYVREGLHAGVAKCYLAEAGALRTLGRVECASLRVDSARHKCESRGMEDAAASCDVMQAMLLGDRGRFEEALVTLERAREVYESRAMREDAANCSELIAVELRRLGRLDDALALLDQAQVAYGPALPDSDRARLLVNRANILMDLGRAEEALSILDSAREVCWRHADALHTAYCDRGRADAFLHLDRAEEAVATYESAGESFLNCGAQASAAGCDRARALAYGQLDRHEEALGLLASARETFSRLGMEVDVAICDQNRAVALERLARFEEALALHGSTSETFCCLGILDGLLRSQHGLARAHSALGDEDAALASYRSACDSLEGALERAGGSEIDQAGFRETLPDPFTPAVSILLSRAEAAISDEEKTALLTDAFALTERARSRKLREELVRSLRTSGVDLSSLDPGLAARWRAVVAEISALDRRLRDPEARGARSEAEELEGQQERRSALMGDLASLEDELFGADVESGGIITGRLPEVSDILAALSEGETLVAYFPLEGDLAVFLATREGVTGATRVRGGMAALSSPLHSLLERAEGGAQDEEGWGTDLASLGEVLLSPLVETGVLSSASRLTVVPASELHAVPFSALRVPGRDAYLVELLPVSVVPQAATRSYQKDKTATGTRRVAVVDPDATLAWGGAEFASLTPHTDDGYFRDQKGPVDAERFAKIAESAAVLHIACHGVFEERDPLSSALVFGPPGSPEPVTVRRLYGLAARLFLVVANACETGRGRVYAGDAHLGLSRALLYLARHVVATLWRIDDRAAAFFAAAFHAALEEGLDPVEATASAQERMIADPALSHPAHWAAYRVMG